MTPRATIYDVAAAAGVSKSLVSLVLQGSPKVSATRREAVHRAMRELNYRPSRAAAALAGNRSRTIGVVIDDFNNPWFIDLLDGLRDVLEPLGVTPTITDSARDSIDGQTALDNLVSARADAIVIACEPTAEMVAAADVPLFIAGNRARSIDGATIIASDDALGGRIATRHLLDLGHRSIAFLSGAGGSARLRELSYLDEMRRAGLRPIVVPGPGATNEPEGFATATALLRDEPGVTAIFAANDSMAFGARAALTDAGLRVPHDVSLVGYDNSAVAKSQLLRLTTMEDNSREVGRRVARAALAAQAGEPFDEGAPVEPELVVRASTGSPRP